MKRIRTAQWAALTATTMLVMTAGCSAGAQPDHAATAGPTPTGPAVTLTIGTDDSPGVPSADEISHFADEVKQLSAGRITIKPRWHAEGRGHPTDWDQAVAAMVTKGDLDLALGPSWAWDELGVTSLQPLQAPFLVDSDELVAAVIRDEDLSHKLMAGLPAAGVQGISLWPEGLRHPFGFKKPLTSLDDYAGQTIRSAKSAASTMLFKALGASTSAKDPDATTMVGSQGEYLLKPNGIGVVNITFFPKVNVLYANAKTLDGLDPAAKQVLADAAARTQEWAVAKTDDRQAASAFCADDGVLVRADDKDVQALQAAAAKVTPRIAAAKGNAAVLKAITSLKATLTPAEPAATCAGAKPTEHQSATPAPALEGTYRFTLTKDELIAANLPKDYALDNAGVQTFTLKDGKAHVRLDASERGPESYDQADGTYEVDGSQITFHFPAYDNEVDHLAFEVVGKGDLKMTPVKMSDPRVAILMTTKTWQKIS